MTRSILKMGAAQWRQLFGSTLSMIDAQILEVPKSQAPLRLRGVGETSIVWPLAAIGIAVSKATACWRVTSRSRRRAFLARWTSRARPDGPGTVLVFPGRRRRGGRMAVKVAAKDIGELFRKLAVREPGRQALIDRGGVDRRDDLSQHWSLPWLKRGRGAAAAATLRRRIGGAAPTLRQDHRVDHDQRARKAAIAVLLKPH